MIRIANSINNIIITVSTTNNSNSSSSTNSSGRSRSSNISWLGGDLLGPFPPTVLKCNLIFFTPVRWGIEYWHPVYLHILNFRRLPKIAKSDSYIRHVSPALYKNEKTGLAVQGFPRNLIFYYFSKIFRKYSSCINSGKNNGLITE
jgi:hypothetical protein